MIDPQPSQLLKDLDDYVHLGRLPPGEAEPRDFLREILSLLKKTVPYYLDRFN